MSDVNLNNLNEQERLQNTPTTSRVHGIKTGKTFTASCRMVFAYPQDSVDLKLISQAATECGFRLLDTTEKCGRFKCGINWRSFGEKLTIQLFLVDNQTLADIRSVCSLPTTIADWGKNEKNIIRIHERLNAILPAEARGSSLQCCPSCGLILADRIMRFCSECASPVREDWPTQIRTGVSSRLAIITCLLFVFLSSVISLAFDSLLMGDMIYKLVPVYILIVWGVMIVSGGVLFVMLIIAVPKHLKKLKSEAIDSQKE